MPDVIKQVNWIDILYVILFLGMVYKGIRTGVGGQILSLIGWFMLTFLSIGYYDFLSRGLFGFLLQDWARPLSFFIISALIFIVIKFIERLFHVISGEEVAAIEKIGGALVAAIRASILFGIIGIFILLLPLDYAKEAATGGSKSCMFFVEFDAQIYSWMTNITGIDKKDKDEVIDGILYPESEEE